MTRVFGRYVPVEMAVLALIESLVSFTILWGVMSARGSGHFSWAAFDIHLANRAAWLALTIVVCAVTIGLYRLEVCLDRRRLILNASVAAVLAFPAALIVGGQFGDGLTRTYAVGVAKVLVVWFAFAITIRFLASTLQNHLRLRRRILLVGADPAALSRSAGVSALRGRLFDPVASSIPVAELGTLEPETLRRRGTWGMVISADVAHSADPQQQKALIDCRLRGIRLFDEVSFSEQHLGRVNLECIGASWFLQSDGFWVGYLSCAVKRAIDIIASLVLLILTLPLMLGVSILIRLETPGPALYRQERVGLHGKIFTLFKFRSMRVDAEAGGKPVWAAKRDPRITRVGSIIRQTRIDELPQLLNVLRGEMSLTGPRPERPLFVEQLDAVIPFYAVRSYVKPGITGWAQVNYPYGASVEDAREKLSYDLYYVKNRGVVLDLLILISTVRVILFREGAR